MAVAFDDAMHPHNAVPLNHHIDPIQWLKELRKKLLSVK